MSALEYVGADISDPADVVYKGYIDTVKAADPSDAHIDSVIAAALSSYATKSYADTRDALLATQAYIDTQDNLRLKLAQKGQANGIAPLDATGKISPIYIDTPLAQNWILGPWSPSAYNGSIVQAQGTEQTVYSCGVTDPGFPYKLVVFGTADVATAANGVNPLIRIRQGDAVTGPIVAQGSGSAEFYGGATDDFERVSTTDLGADWSQTYLSGTQGTLATGNGHAAAVIPDAFPFQNTYCQARRIKTGETAPSGDYMRIRFTLDAINSTPINNHGWLDILGRWQSDNSNYVVFRFLDNNVVILYSASGGAQNTLTTAACSLQAGSTYDVVWGVTPSSPRRYQVYRDGILMHDFTETGTPTTLSSSARGWGFGLQTRANIGVATIGQIRMFDTLFPIPDDPASEAVIAPVNLAALSTLTGATTLYVRLIRDGSLGSVSANTFKPKLYVQAIPV